MRHPEISAWTDYVRAVADTGNLAAMQQHLDGGCPSCRATVAALGRVITTAEIDGAISPPAGAIRSVKAFFDVKHPEAQSSWRDRFVRASFDSALQPAPAASRALGDNHRQLLFESDDYTIELSVDHAPGEVDSVVRGQILEARGAPRSHAPVFLVDDGEVIGRAISQQHGTFEMAGPSDHPFQMWVFPDDDNRIRLTVDPR